MNVTLTNTGTDPETVAGIQGATVTLGGGAQRGGTAWTEVLQPGQPFDTSGDTSVVIVGDKPSVRTQIEQGIDTATKAVKEMYDAIRNRRRPVIGGETPPPVSVSITNHGPNAVRVILGDGVNDITVQPGTTQAATGPGYLELRELGTLDPSQRDGGTQPSSAA